MGETLRKLTRAHNLMKCRTHSSTRPNTWIYALTPNKRHSRLGGCDREEGKARKIIRAYTGTFYIGTLTQETLGEIYWT